MVVGGVGLLGGTMGEISVSAPAGATVVGALLYWGARGNTVDPSDITVDKDAVSAMVTGMYAGESVNPGPDSHTLRADLFGLFDWSGTDHTIDLVVPGDQGIEGASLVLLYTDDTTGSLALWDGNDYAYLGEGLETELREFSFSPIGEARDAKLWIVVGDVENMRPNRLDYEVDGDPPASVENPFGDGRPWRDGPEWDTYSMDLTIPANGEFVRVQLFSEDNAAGALGLPASMYWVVAALEILDPPPPPPPPSGGEGCTPGYWKQPHHFDSWTAPYDPTDLFSVHFDDAFSGMTLLDVLKQGGGGLKALGRHTVAAVLNAASGGVDYDLTEANIIDGFNDLYPDASKSEYNGLKDVFADFNEQGCPLN